MTSKDPSAFIPTNKHDAAEIGWKEMPRDSILTALAERCRGRVIRSDDNWIRSGAAKPNFGGGSIVGLDCGQGLWVELQLA